MRRSGEIRIAADPKVSYKVVKAVVAATAAAGLPNVALELARP
jgi:biopolymer transport protein ExbD